MLPRSRHPCKYYYSVATQYVRHSAWPAARYTPAIMWNSLFKPVRIVTLSFLAAIAPGTAALMMPFMTLDGKGASVLQALFTATSAICVTGLSDEFENIASADTTDPDVLKQLGAADFERAVVGIGSNIEASILTVMALSDLGVKTIWAKATHRTHGRILERTGADHVVYPEERMGLRVARLVTERMMDYIEFEEDFSIIKTRAPDCLVGKHLAEAACMSQFSVALIGVKPPSAPFVVIRDNVIFGPDDAYIIRPDDLLIVAGPNRACEDFAALA